MPDELENFFAKKKGKDKRKKNALHVGDIGEYLDQTNRNFELIEREENEYLNRQNEKESKEGENREEDSEWLEAAPEEDMSSRFAEIGIKEMDASELTEDEEEQETKIENIATKTWKNPVEAPAETTPQYTITTSKKYVPPVARSGRRGGAEIDLKNEEMFPSIANAEKIEKVEKSKVEDRKTVKANQQAGWKTQETKTSNAYRPPQTRTNNPITSSNNTAPKPSPAPAAATTQPPVKTNKYVPPAKRNA
jgi:hypothetical protein